MRSGSLYGRLRNRTAFTTEKTAVFAPIPSASIITAASVNPGFFASSRAPNSTSRHTVPIHAPARTSLTRSFTCSTPSLSTSAARRASSALIPARIFCVVIRSTYARSSASRSDSTRSRCTRFFHVLDSRRMIGIAPPLPSLRLPQRLRVSASDAQLRRLQRAGNRQRDPAPLLDLGFELPPPFPRQPVVFRLPVVFRFAPFR